MKITFAAMTESKRKDALSSFAASLPDLDDAALTAALDDVKTQAKALFALEAPTLDQANEADALVAAKGHIVEVQASRKAEADDAAARFAAAKQSFAAEDEAEESDEDAEPETEDEPETEESDEDAEDAEDETQVEAAKGENPFDKKKKKMVDPEDDEEEKKAMTASARTFAPAKSSTAKRVAAKTTRPAAPATKPVVITAAADVPGIATGAKIDDMVGVAEALMSRVSAFAPHNPAAAEAINAETHGAPRLAKYGVAHFGLDTKSGLTRNSGAGAEYQAIQDAIKDHNTALVAAMSQDKTLTAAGWCAPSTIGYNWLADYVVDGLITMPETDAPRGGLMTTTGPALADEYLQNGSDFGFVQTETQAEARTPKTCETIICPDFIDHRLDAMGYCWKIPLLTESAYPELVADALRLSSVLFAHKQNTRFINDIIAGSTAINATGALGASFTDTLEALTIVAVKERRKWNVGVNAVMEVKMPAWVKEVFRADISRRQGITVEVVSDEQINAQFTARHLAPEYVSDFDELTGANPVFNANFRALIYPAGTWVRVVKDVINLTAVHDAASLTVNEYTGVFFEQGIMTFKAGYRSHVVTIPVCTAGLVGAAVLDCNPLTLNNEGPDADAT